MWLRQLRILGCASKMKPSLCSAALKTIVDGWCTPGNFGNTVGSCPFCGSEENDKLEHFATCAGVGEAVRFAWRIDMPSLDRHLVPYSADDDCWAVKHMFCLASVYNSCRHGRHFPNRRTNHLGLVLLYVLILLYRAIGQPAVFAHFCPMVAVIELYSGLSSKCGCLCFQAHFYCFLRRPIDALSSKTVAECVPFLRRTHASHLVPASRE